MKPIVLILGGLGLFGLVLAASGSAESETEPPAPLPNFDTPPKNADEATARLGFLRKLRPDADWAADGYSRHSYQLVSAGHGSELWVYSASESMTKAAAEARGLPIDGTGQFGYPIDEYGRAWHGISGDPLGTLMQAAGYALPFIPGVGPAASAALATAIAWAKGKSLEDAALAGARAAVPGGALGQLAFDVGIAVASGKPVDEAAKNALLGQIPGGQEAYEQGQEAWKLYQKAKGYT